MKHPTLYQLRRQSPIAVNVTPDATEVILQLISCMCDNKNTFKFKKSPRTGTFNLDTGWSAYSNFQIKHEQWELEWLADDGQWDDVVALINTGTSVVDKIFSRKVPLK